MKVATSPAGTGSSPLVLSLSEIDKTMTSFVGGKAANLGEMIQAGGLPVPPGFCVTAEGYREFLSSARRTLGSVTVEELFAALESLDPKDVDAVRSIGERVRKTLGSVPIPKEVAKLVVGAWEKLLQDDSDLGANADQVFAVAVRSSATAEDLPGASAAGQQDTYLNVVGAQSVLEHVKSCWISLFTDRAISYRAMNHFDTTKVYLCVVVQKQIDPVSSGVIFTADPVDGRRIVTFIEACFGLGEALVSGLINTDKYKVDRNTGEVIETTVGDKRMEIVPTFANKNGGTRTNDLDGSRRNSQVLNAVQIKSLVDLGCQVQDHYASVPQDIEWCFERGSGRLYLVQSRPITTLFPLPNSAPGDDGLRVCISFGHIQCMTDPIPPCARSAWRLMLPLWRDTTGNATGLVSAGSYLYIDPTDTLRTSKFLTNRFLSTMKHLDPRMASSVESVLKRDSFHSSGPKMGYFRIMMGFAWLFVVIIPRVLWRLLFAPNPETAAKNRLDFMDTHVHNMKLRIYSAKDPRGRLHIAVNEVQNVFDTAIFRIMPFTMAGVLSGALVRKLARGGIATEEDFQQLGQGLAGNVTTDMDLAIGDLADVARGEPTVAAWLREGENVSIDGLSGLDENSTLKFRSALDAFLQRYGARAGSEIDISRPRWWDDPSPILQVVRGNLAREEAGSHRRHHNDLAIAGEAAAKRIVASAPAWKRPILRRFVRTSRSLMALREHHKFLIIQLFGEVRRVAMEFAPLLVESGHLVSASDVWLLTLQELVAAPDKEVGEVQSLVSSRREEHAHSSKMKPPRVLTSQGESVDVAPNMGHYLPPGALPGVAASPGVVEGIAKVVSDPTKAVLHAGEILVAPFTDPGWTPLFINASGLIMEVGGVMTHGSVVAREYGIPGVVCIDDAMTKIKTGMKVRVDGTAGYVEILSETDANVPDGKSD